MCREETQHCNGGSQTLLSRPFRSCSLPVNFSQLTLVLKPCHLPCGSTHFFSGLSFSQNTRRTSIIPLTLLVISASVCGSPPRQPLLAEARGPIAQIGSPLSPSQEPPGLGYSLTSWGAFNSPRVFGSYSNHPAGKKKPSHSHTCMSIKPESKPSNHHTGTWVNTQTIGLQDVGP